MLEVDLNHKRKTRKTVTEAMIHALKFKHRKQCIYVNLQSFVSHNFAETNLRQDTDLVLTIKGILQYEVENNRISTTSFWNPLWTPKAEHHKWSEMKWNSQIDKVSQDDIHYSPSLFPVEFKCYWNFFGEVFSVKKDNEGRDSLPGGAN